MVRTRGGHIDPSASREARPSASTPQDPSQASQALTMPSPESRVPFIPPQRRYSTWRPPISPPPEPSVHRVPPKSARTSGPRETSSYATTARPLGFVWIAPDVPSRASDDSQRVFLPRVAMDFYQSMTTQDVQGSIAIRFSIDGRQGILEARHIAKALHIPFQPEDLKQFRQWTSTSQRTWFAFYHEGLLEIHAAT
ncbi:hypothetical protein CK203_102772 [Vitis vinifera]|uniref:Uncharacterized protein n=1 Tax=Vitis vinifera TaxID=29760 RepID=A0A438FFD3_VITVI|nr:hypothetical protein CK203_102772 [Vitis vinifera]